MTLNANDPEYRQHIFTMVEALKQARDIIEDVPLSVHQKGPTVAVLRQQISQLNFRIGIVEGANQSQGGPGPEIGSEPLTSIMGIPVDKPRPDVVMSEKDFEEHKSKGNHGQIYNDPVDDIIKGITGPKKTFE